LRVPESVLPEEVRVSATMDRLGKFEITALLGRGAAAEVFKVRDARTHEAFVLKRMRPHTERHLDLARFTREAELMRRLKHPNLMPVLHVDTAAKPPYYVMPWREGITLTERVQQGRLPVAEVLRVARDASLGLSEAHQLGIVHRDVKPANIFLEATGRAVVLDFGLAKDLEGTDALTAAGTLLGTPAYMAPEQCRGEPVDSQADVYALGVTLIELVLGKNPFASKDVVETLRRHLTLDTRRLDALLPGRVPPELGEIVHRMVAKNPAHRPVTHSCYETFAALARRSDAAARAATLQVTRPSFN
jgi:serine/threonine protein kinase